MTNLIFFVRHRWEEIVILGLAIPTLLSASTTGNWALAAATIAAVVLIFFFAERLAQRRLAQHIGENVAFRLPRRGIVFTVGKQIATIEFAVARQRPDLVGFVCSTETEPFADRVIAQFGIDAERARKSVVDVGNLREIHAATVGLIEWMRGRGLPTRMIVVDVTGGMTTLSLGAFAAAEANQVDSQYIKSRYGSDNKIIEGSQEGILVVRYTDLPAS